MDQEYWIDQYLQEKRTQGELKSGQKILIGFAGIPGSGKTTLAKILGEPI